MDYCARAPMPREQTRLFHPTLDELISEDHEVRILDELLASCDWSEWEAEYHGSRGQPPIPPQKMARLILYGLMRGIRSSRQLEYVSGHNIDFLWLLEGHQPDHTKICRFRNQFEQPLRSLFLQIGRIAMGMGLIRLGEIGLDGTRVRAANSRGNTATAGSLEKRLAELEQQFADRWQQVSDQDEADRRLFGDGTTEVPDDLQDAQQRRQKLQEALQQVRQQDADRRRRGIDPQQNPAQIPLSDPDSRVLPNKEGGFAPNYTPVAATDGTAGFLVDLDVLVDEAEHDTVLPAVDRIAEEFGQKPGTVLADGAFPTAANLAGLEERGIELLAPGQSRELDPSHPAYREDPTQPLPEELHDQLPENGRGQIDSIAFSYDAEQDCYYCPLGQRLDYRQSKQVRRSGGPVTVRIYQCGGCEGCPLRDRCLTPQNRNGRTVRHDEHRERRQEHARRMEQPDAQTRFRRRSWVAETPFAVIKGVFGVRRFLVRGLTKVRQEWRWIGTAFNLRKLTLAVARLRPDLPGGVETAAAEPR